MPFFVQFFDNVPMIQMIKLWFLTGVFLLLNMMKTNGSWLPNMRRCASGFLTIHHSLIRVELKTEQLLELTRKTDCI
jgi:hypothetical protein